MSVNNDARSDFESRADSTVVTTNSQVVTYIAILNIWKPIFRLESTLKSSTRLQCNDASLGNIASRNAINVAKLVINHILAE